MSLPKPKSCLCLPQDHRCSEPFRHKVHMTSFIRAGVSGCCSLRSFNAFADLLVTFHVTGPLEPALLSVSLLWVSLLFIRPPNLSSCARPQFCFHLGFMLVCWFVQAFSVTLMDPGWLQTRSNVPAASASPAPGLRCAAALPVRLVLQDICFLTGHSV